MYDEEECARLRQFFLMHIATAGLGQDPQALRARSRREKQPVGYEERERFFLPLPCVLHPAVLQAPLLDFCWPEVPEPGRSPRLTSRQPGRRVQVGGNYSATSGAFDQVAMFESFLKFINKFKMSLYLWKLTSNTQRLTRE